MANSYRTIEPCTLGEIVEAALEDGFTVTHKKQRDGLIVMCGLIHEDGRGCHGMCEEQGDDGLTYVGCISDPKVPVHEMDVDQDS